MNRTMVLLPVRHVADETVTADQDYVAAEDPLQIRIGGRDLALIMRTPGNDTELAAGFLFSEGITRQPGDLISLTPDGKGAIVAQLGPNTNADLPLRGFYVNSSCGICGKASVDSLRELGCARLDPACPLLDHKLVLTLPEMLRCSQTVFDRTGGLHAAGLYDVEAQSMFAVREDIGRHNAVDKLIGAAFLERRLPLSASVLVLSGRVSFELVQKALLAGIPIVAAVGAPSSLAVEAARRYGMTLIGFVRDNRFNIYAGDSRIPGTALRC